MHDLKTRIGVALGALAVEQIVRPSWHWDCKQESGMLGIYLFVKPKPCSRVLRNPGIALFRMAKPIITTAMKTTTPISSSRCR